MSRTGIHTEPQKNFGELLGDGRKRSIGQEAQHLFMKEQVVHPDWGVSEVQGTGR